MPIVIQACLAIGLCCVSHAAEAPTLTTATPGATIHWNWQSPPQADNPKTYNTPIEAKAGGLLYARASQPGPGDSPLFIAGLMIRPIPKTYTETASP